MLEYFRMNVLISKYNLVQLNFSTIISVICFKNFNGASLIACWCWELVLDVTVQVVVAAAQLGNIFLLYIGSKTKLNEGRLRRTKARLIVHEPRPSKYMFAALPMGHSFLRINVKLRMC